MRQANEINFNQFLDDLRASFKLSVSEKAKDGKKTFQRYLSFLLADEIFALPIWQLSEILTDKVVVSIPGASSRIHGMINYRNHILQVSNIHHMLLIGSHHKKNPSFLLITKAIEPWMALLVDRLESLISIDRADIKTEETRNQSNKFITGKIFYKERLITILDLMKFNYGIEKND